MKNEVKTNKKYKFSIIMSVYNVENYIDEAIESIINQDIGFENVQLILVNDGSTDNVEEKCLYYDKKYDNVKYIYKENGGLSSARNVGMKYVKGEYVTFTDPDDTLNKNVLSSVYKFFEKNKLFVDMVCVPLYFFEAMEGLHPKYKYMGEKNRIINLLEEPYNFILSSASMFYKYSKIKDMRFDESMYGSEDLEFNVHLYKNNYNIGYVCSNNAFYNYRQREAQDSIHNKTKTDIRAFTSFLNTFKSFDSDLLDYQKEIILYELRPRLMNIRKEFFETEAEYNNIINEYKKYLKMIPDDYILTRTKCAERIQLKVLFMMMKGKSIDKVFDNEMVTNIKVLVKDYCLKNDKLIIETLFYNYNIDDIDIVMFDEHSNIYSPVSRLDIDSPYNLKHGEFELDKTHYRKFEIDLKPKRLKFAIKLKDKYVPAASMILDNRTRLHLKFNGVGLRYKNKILSVSGAKEFRIKKCSSSTLKYNIVTVLKIFKHYRFFPLMRLLNKRNKKYILINDRPDKAGDNGEALFKYICEHEKDMKKNTYFVIDKKCDDYKRLKNYGKVVNVRSIKHKYLQLNAKYIYSSHNARIFYNAFDGSVIRFYSDMFNYDFIWLQHGITINDISSAANRLSTKNKKVVVATNEEFNEFTKDKYFFNKNDILLTGFARYDFLENRPENIITICPTWRQSLSGKILPDGTHETLPDFEESDYYLNYKEILGSDKLKKLLKKYDYQLNFVLHPGVINYKEHFDKYNTDRIHILKQSDVNYSKIFSESKLLITDYSSVLFDFAYLKKPEIFFQFDADEFFTEHYKKGYFSYERDAFGDVVKTSKDVIDKIEFYFNNGFKMEDKYLKRVNKTFKYTDKNNCKRIIEKTYKKTH